MTSDGKTRNTQLVLAAVGAAIGAGCGFTVGRLIKHQAIDLSRLAWSDTTIIFIGVSMIAIGAVVAAATVVRALSKRMIEPAAGRTLTPPIARFYRLQAAVLLLAGIMLLLPVIGTLLPDRAPARTALFVLVLILFGLQTYANLLIWRRSDEFLRKVIADTGAVCFWLLQGGLFLWAAGERLAMLPRLSSWDAVAILMLVYGAASASISLRRGVS
jgi:hypothetical protein